MRTLIWLSFPLIVMASCHLAGASDHSPCDVSRSRTGWHVFVDHKDRFCFAYPPKYHVAPAVVAPGVSKGSATEFIARLTTKPSPSQGATAEDPNTATIDVLAYGIPLRPDDLTRFAPNGYEDIPPRHIHAAHAEFYYYGAGGGGTDYPDVFYFGIRGRTFAIEFVGPYSQRGKSPDTETTAIEPEVLASFRSF